jgi:carboxymethylenebutenolidase
MGRSVGVTTAIAQFMRDLEGAWEAHREALLVRRDLAAALAPMAADLALNRISRTVDRWRLVEEATVSFTHDRELPWLLPGAEPTFRRAEVLAIAVVGFHRMKISSLRVLWDHATLTAQLNIKGQLNITAPGATAPGR